jgi:hypothetical protein
MQLGVYHRQSDDHFRLPQHRLMVSGIARLRLLDRTVASGKSGSPIIAIDTGSIDTFRSGPPSGPDGPTLQLVRRLIEQLRWLRGQVPAGGRFA